MRRFPRWLTATRFRLGLAYGSSVLVGVTLLALALGALISPLVASVDSAHAGGAQAVAVSSLKPKPTRTPHNPPATVTPSPTATPPAATATVAPTAAATRTVNPGAGSGGSAGSNGDGALAADGPPGLLVLGLAALALLAFSVFMLLETRRVPRKEQRKEQPRTLPAAAQSAAPAQVNQRQQVLPVQKAAPPLSAEDATERPLEQGETKKPLLPLHETPPAPLKPPCWLIDAGLLQEEQWEPPAEDSREL